MNRTSFVAPAFVPFPAVTVQPAPRGFAADDDATGYVEPAFLRRAATKATVRAAPAGLVTWISDPATLSPAAKLVDGRAYSVVCDHLGTPVLMLDGSGHRVWEAVLSTWGAAKILLGEAGDCPHRFAGAVRGCRDGAGV